MRFPIKSKVKRNNRLNDGIHTGRIGPPVCDKTPYEIEFCLPLILNFILVFRLFSGFFALRIARIIFFPFSFAFIYSLKCAKVSRFWRGFFAECCGWYCMFMRVFFFTEVFRSSIFICLRTIRTNAQEVCAVRCWM